MASPAEALRLLGYHGFLALRLRAAEKTGPAINDAVIRQTLQSAMRPKRTNYLDGAQIRAAIHNSKKTFCWYAEDRYSDFDLIVQNITEITADAARNAMPEKARVATRVARAIERAKLGRNLKAFESEALVVDPAIYNAQDVVFRLMTTDHVPDDPDAKGQRKKSGKVEVNFPPFKHYTVDEDGQLTEVGRSHWQGSLSNGGFCITHGKVSNELGKMYMMLAKKFASKGNWRNYSYNEEMQGTALVTLCQHGLKFDESKSDNAFAYLTVCMQNAFVRVLNQEKKVQGLRDDLLESAGQEPSSSRQVENELKAKPPVN